MAEQGYDGEHIDQLFAAKKDSIREAYQGDRGRGKTLREIKTMLEQHHDFPPLPLSTYEVKLRQLGLRKKVSRDDWLPIWQHCQQIKQQGGEPVIFLNGTPLKWEKAWKEIRRNGAHKTAPPVRCPSLPSHIVVIAASASARPIVLAERTSPVVSIQRALPSTACELLNTVGRRQAVTRDASSRMPQKDLLVNLPWFQFISSVQVYAEVFLSPQQHSGRPIAPNLMEQLSQYFGNAMDLRNLDLSLLRAHDENLASCTALTVEFDAVYFLAKAVFRLSNGLINPEHLSLEDGLLYAIIMSRIPKPFLLIFLRSDSPSARAAHQALLELSSYQGDVQTFKFLATANNGHLQQQLRSSARFIRAAAKLKQCDILRSCLDSITASAMSLTVLISLLGEEEAPSVSVLAARTLSRLFDFKRRDIWDQLRGYDVSMWMIVETTKKWNHSVVTILLEAGLNIDDTCAREIDRHSLGFRDDGLWILHDLYVQNNVPMPWRVSILDFHYYNSTAQYSMMRLYSLRLGTVFDRHGLCRAGREGARTLSKYLSRWHADSETHGLTQFLQLFLVEQLWLKKQEPDWLLINNLLDYGVDPSLPDLDGMSFRDLFCGMIICIANHGPTDAGRRTLQRLIHGGAQLDALALLTAVSKEGIHGLDMVQSLGADLASFGPYALFRALKFNNTEAIDWLLERGVDPLRPIQDGVGSYFTVLGAAVGCYSEVPTSIGQTINRMLRYFVNEHDRSTAADAVLSLVCSRSRPFLRPDDTGPIDLLITIIQALSHDYDPAKHGNNLRLLCKEASQLPSSKIPQLLENIACLGEWDLFEEIANQGQLAGPGNPLACLIIYEAPPTLIRKMLRLTPDHNAKTLTSPNYYSSHISASEAAAHCWNVGLLRELVSAGSDTDRAVSDVWINRSLCYACRFNTLSAAEAQAQMETAQYLLELGVPTEGPVISDMVASPLQMASWNGSLELVLLLLKHGADFNSAHRVLGKQMTPLDIAAKHGRLDIVQVLLNIGAISYSTQFTPLDGAIDHALLYSHHETAKLLCRYALSKKFQLSQEHSKLLL